jgi:hypothetical protein
LQSAICNFFCHLPSAIFLGDLKILVHLPVMPPISRKFLRYLRHLPLLVVYVLFFIVQLFFNLDVSAASSPGTPAATVKLLHSSKTLAVNTATTQGSFKKKIRLNKRFQPSAAACITHYTVTESYAYTQPVVMGVYADPYYVSPFIAAYSLRGPPACA